MTLELPDIKPQATTCVPLHALLFHEIAASKKPVTSIDGYLVGGPDRRGANAVSPNKLWPMWQRDVQARLDSVEPRISDYFVRTKHMTTPPREGEDIRILGSNPPLDPRPLVFDDAALSLEGPVIDLELEAGKDFQVLGAPVAPQETGKFDVLKMSGTPAGGDLAPKKKLANPPRFTWSYTAIQDFLNCPYQFAAKRYFKTLKEAPSPQMLEGQRVHKAFENAIIGCATAEDNQVLARVKGEKYVAAFLKARAEGATVMAEQQLAVDEDLKPCDWFDPRGAAPRVFGRGVLDVGVMKDDTFNIYDFKTGKLKDDPLQLRVFCAFAAQHFPNIQRFNAKFIWLKDDKITGLDKPITREDIPAIWSEILTIVNRMRAAWDSENFRYQSGGLCRNWCSVRECPHCGAK